MQFYQHAREQERVQRTLIGAPLAAGDLVLLVETEARRPDACLVEAAGDGAQIVERRQDTEEIRIGDIAHLDAACQFFVVVDTAFGCCDRARILKIGRRPAGENDRQRDCGRTVSNASDHRLPA